MKILFQSIFFFNIIFVISSCAIFSSNENGSYRKSDSLENTILKNLPPPWIAINHATSDFAITNSLTHSVFLINSACRKYEASNLKSLTSAMLSGVDIINIIENKLITFQERDAVDMTVLGKVDGIQSYFHLLTTQKNNCIYDFVLISTNEKNLQNDNSYFQVFLKGIVIK